MLFLMGHVLYWLQWSNCSCQQKCKLKYILVDSCFFVHLYDHVPTFSKKSYCFQARKTKNKLFLPLSKGRYTDNQSVLSLSVQYLNREGSAWMRGRIRILCQISGEIFHNITRKRTSCFCESSDKVHADPVNAPESRKRGSWAERPGRTDPGAGRWLG